MGKKDVKDDYNKRNEYQNISIKLTKKKKKIEERKKLNGEYWQKYGGKNTLIPFWWKCNFECFPGE